MKKLLPFNLNKALAGAEVVTRDKKEVTIIRFSKKWGYPLLVKIGSHYLRYTEFGEYYCEDTPSRLDLFLVASEPRKTHFSCGSAPWNTDYFYQTSKSNKE